MFGVTFQAEERMTRAQTRAGLITKTFKGEVCTPSRGCLPDSQLDASPFEVVDASPDHIT